MQGAAGAAEVEPEGQCYLEVQRHAAAVQLHQRSLAIAQLRALMAMPRGGAVAVQQGRQQRTHIKPEPGTAAATRHQQPVNINKPVISVSVSSTAADLQLPPPPAALQQPQQQAGPGKHALLKPRLLVRRLPDMAAAARFRADELPDEPSVEEAEQSAEQPLVAGRAAAAAGGAGLAPRIVGDPALIGHQLAGWAKVAADGDDEAAAGGVDAEELLGPGLGAAGEDDEMDEEEWI